MTTVFEADGKIIHHVTAFTKFFQVDTALSSSSVGDHQVVQVRVVDFSLFGLVKNSSRRI